MSALIWAILSVFMWSTLLLLIRGSRMVWPVGATGVFARIISVSLLLGLVCLTGRGWRRLNPQGMGWWLVLMGFNASVINICWFAGMGWTTATNAALLFRLDLLFVVIIGMSLGLERINRIGLMTAPVMFLGLALLMEVQRLDFTGHALGDTMVVIAAVGLATNAFVIRHILRRMDGQAVAAYNHAMSGLGFAGIMLVQGVAVPKQVVANPNLWGWIVFLGLASSVSLPVYYAALRRMAVWKLRVFLLLCPLIVAMVDWLVWGESLQGLQWLGGALLLGGAMVLTLSEARAAKASARPPQANPSSGSRHAN